MTDEDAQRLHDLYANGQAIEPSVFEYRMDVKGFAAEADFITVGPGIPIMLSRSEN